jgi:hypothetical protein
MTPETCPNCGAEVPPKARACPECGSDEQTGWSEAAETADLGLPDEEFNYSDFVKREFGENDPAPAGKPLKTWLLALLALAIIVLLVIFLRSGH